MSDFKNSRWWI